MRASSVDPLRCLRASLLLCFD